MSKVKEKFDQAEVATDSFLQKLKDNPYTVVIVASGAITVLVIWVLVG